MNKCDYCNKQAVVVDKENKFCEDCNKDETFYLVNVEPFLNQIQWKKGIDWIYTNIRKGVMEAREKGIPEKMIQRYLKEKQIPYKEPNPYNELFYETKHLPFFKEFESIIGLHGKQYDCVKKVRFYQIIGGVLQKCIKLGGAETDTRIQALYPLPTEQGKNNLIYSFKSLFDLGVTKENTYDEEMKEKMTLYKLSQPISYSPESLIGKVVERSVENPDYLQGLVKKPKKVKQRIVNKGHFNNDFIELDECSSLIFGYDKDTIQAREYFSKSENPIGKNEVEKRLVDDLPSEVVKYIPKNTNSFYFQPSEKIPENIMTQGFMRRKLIPIGDVSKFLVDNSEELMDRRLSDNLSKEEQIVKLAKFLRSLKINIGAKNFSFTEEAKKLIVKYSVMISNQGKIHSEKISNYVKVNKFTTNDNLIKMSCIIASLYGETQIEERHVSLAFMDLTEVMQNTYDFIYNHVKGNFDYGVTWSGAKYYDVQCLKYLHEEEAMSFESSKISIGDFLERIRDVYPNDIGHEQARKHYNRMKKENWIEGKQKGQYESRVWLKFNPKIHKDIDEGVQGSKGYTAYKSVFLGINDILSGIQSLPSLISSNDREGENHG